jgi:hypothetical protein
MKFGNAVRLREAESCLGRISKKGHELDRLIGAHVMISVVVYFVEWAPSIQYLYNLPVSILPSS